MAHEEAIQSTNNTQKDFTKSTQKQYPNKSEHTATLTQFYFTPQAPPTSIYTNPNEKEKKAVTSLRASSSLVIPPRLRASLDGVRDSPLVRRHV